MAKSRVERKISFGKKKERVRLTLIRSVVDGLWMVCLRRPKSIFYSEAVTRTTAEEIWGAWARPYLKELGL